MTALTPQQRDRLQAAIDELAAVIIQTGYSTTEAIAEVNRALQLLDRPIPYVLADRRTAGGTTAENRRPLATAAVMAGACQRSHM